MLKVLHVITKANQPKHCVLSLRPFVLPFNAVINTEKHTSENFKSYVHNNAIKGI